jgi:hypothetical protein
VQLSYAGNNLGFWTPIRQFNRTDADVTLFFLSANDIRYGTPIDDPLFSAHKNVSDFNVNNGSVYYFPSWQTDNLVSILGCTDQYQFCNPTTAECTLLDGLSNTHYAAQKYKLNSLQQHTCKQILSAASDAITGGPGLVLGGSALAASASLYTLSQPTLPDNQWTIEATWWFKNRLAGLQYSLVDFASGPNVDPALGGVILNDGSSETQYLCNNQKILSNGDYQNFSVLGLVIVFGVGGFIIILSLILPSLVGRFQSTSRAYEYKKLQWESEQYLELYRKPHDSVGSNKQQTINSLNTDRLIFEPPFLSGYVSRITIRFV